MALRREGMIGEAIRSAKQARKTLASYVQDLEPQEFRWRPAPEANPILWILWHLGEVEESVLWTLGGKRPPFHFGRSALKARGSDDLPRHEEVLKYLEDVRGRYLARLEALPEEALDQVFGEGVWQGKARGLIALPPRHETYHLGQIGYIRRLMGKPVPDANESNPYQ